MDHQDPQSVCLSTQEVESTGSESLQICVFHVTETNGLVNKENDSTIDFKEKDREMCPGEKQGMQTVEQVTNVSAVTVPQTPDVDQLGKGKNNNADGHEGGKVVLNNEIHTKSRRKKSQRQEDMTERRRSQRGVKEDDLADLHVHFGGGADESVCENKTAPQRRKRKGKNPQRRVKKNQTVDQPAAAGRPGRKRRVTLCQVDISSDVLELWRDIGRQRSLHSDADVAALLVKHYQATDGVEPCTLCKSPLRLLCPRCPPPPTSLPSVSSITSTTTTTTTSSSVPCPPSLPSSTPVRSLVVVKTEKKEEEEGREDVEEVEDIDIESLPSEESGKSPGKRGRKRKGERKSHICSECGASFVRAGALKIHIRRHTGEKPFSCDECDRAFTTSGQLVNHRRKHTGERPYVCHICNATFPIASSLKQHSRIHTGVRPYACHVCQQRFSYRGDLTAHVRTHTGDRPFLCSDCGKSFAMSSHLNKHKRIHSGYRPFECEICHKTFPFLNRLTLHKRTHTGEKPFLCADCGSSFIRASTLTIHRRIHHTFEKPCICPFCNHAFADSANLSKHKKHKHGAQKRAVKQSSAVSVTELAEQLVTDETRFVQVGAVAFPVMSMGVTETSANKVCGKVASLQTFAEEKRDDGGLAMGRDEVHSTQLVKNIVRWDSC